MSMGEREDGANLGEYAVVKHIALFLHARHEGVVGEGIGAAAVLVIDALDLAFKSLDLRLKNK